MIPTIPITRFPFYSNNPEKGLTKHTDSVVIQQEIEYQDNIYDIKFWIEIDYTRWYQQSTTFEPKEDYIELLRKDIELIKVEPSISDKEFRKMERWLNETLAVE